MTFEFFLIFISSISIFYLLVSIIVQFCIYFNLHSNIFKYNIILNEPDINSRNYIIEKYLLDGDGISNIKIQYKKHDSYYSLIEDIKIIFYINSNEYIINLDYLNFSIEFPLDNSYIDINDNIRFKVCSELLYRIINKKFYREHLLNDSSSAMNIKLISLIMRNASVEEIKK